MRSVISDVISFSIEKYTELLRKAQHKDAINYITKCKPQND